MKKRVLFLMIVFVCTLLFQVLQKPVFMLFYAVKSTACTPVEWLQVLLHGIPLDVAIAGYVTAVPLLLVIMSLWIRLPDRLWRTILSTYFVIIALFTSAVVAVDLGLYDYWGFRINGSVLIYMANPKEAMASVGGLEALRQIVIFAVYATLMIWGYIRVVRMFSTGNVHRRIPALGLLILLTGVLFLAIRGGLGVATANISKVYFSPNMFLNHAAINPIFSLISTIGNGGDYASQYPFFEESERVAKFEAVRGDRHTDADTMRIVSPRPNVVIIVLESFGRAVVETEVDGELVMPNMDRFKSEGVWFENFYATSFRTDRGQVAILNGFPAQTNISIMKMPEKCSSLPSIARTLAGEGYQTSFTYGGDLNFTNQASYMYSTGWQRLVWQQNMDFDVPTSKWGYADDVVGDYFTNEVLRLSDSGTPFLAGWLTLSSHEPYDVPFDRFDDKMLNAMAFTDHCLGLMIDKWRSSPAWENMLVIMVADHANLYPNGVEYNSRQRHYIPMVWLGGAINKPHVVADYGSQIDLAATLLSQMGLDHTEFTYSKNMFNPALPKFGYYVFDEGFGIVDASQYSVWDCTSKQLLEGVDSALLDNGRALLQTTYIDIDQR